MDPLSAQPERAAAARQLRFWQQQAARLERDRRHLHFVPPVGGALGLAVATVSQQWPYGLAVLALALSTWMMGLYMTTVRRQEYDHHLAEASQALASVEAQSRGNG